MLSRFLFETISSLSDTVEGYELFNQSKILKVIFHTQSIS